MCAGSEFQVDGVETENVQDVKLPVMPEGLERRSVEKTYDSRMEGSG